MDKRAIGFALTNKILEADRSVLLTKEMAGRVVTLECISWLNTSFQDFWRVIMNLFFKALAISLGVFSPVAAEAGLFEQLRDVATAPVRAPLQATQDLLQ